MTWKNRKKYLFQFTLTPPIRSAISGEDKEIRALQHEQTISCSINGLDGAANVKWLDGAGTEIDQSETDNYSLDNGKSGFSAGSQTTQLTLKQPILSSISSVQTFKCAVTSGQYPGSGEFEKDILVTPVGKFSM